MLETVRLDVRRIRALRPPRPVVDPWRAHGTLVEPERLSSGRRARTLTVFLSGAECPFTCVFCDLWRYTTPEATPPGALPAQLRQVFAEQISAVEPTAECHLKLYNASNFFDRRAVPPEDDEALLDLVAPFERVVVESHPKLLGDRCRRWAEVLGPGRLQVAMGLETVHPTAQPRLGKGADLDDFATAASNLAAMGASWRAFVLVGAPYVPQRKTVHWVERTVAFALDHGAEHIALIPLRGGNGALESLAADGYFQPPELTMVEEALDRGLAMAARHDEAAVVTADPWDLESLARCPECRGKRLARIAALNHDGRPRPGIVCTTCSTTCDEEA